MADPPRIRPRTETTDADVRVAESRTRRPRKLRAFACRSTSKPHASTTIRHFQSFGYVPASINTRWVSAATPDFETTISSVDMRALDRATPSFFPVNTPTKSPFRMWGESFATPGTARFAPWEIASTAVSDDDARQVAEEV